MRNQTHAKLNGVTVQALYIQNMKIQELLVFID